MGRQSHDTLVAMTQVRGERKCGFAAMTCWIASSLSRHRSRDFHATRWLPRNDDLIKWLFENL